jgi:ribonuclease HI
MVGDVWNHIPNYEHRATCPTCNTTESMHHILTRCATRANRTIWSLAKRAWPHRDDQWPAISMGLILGIGSLNATNHDRPQDQHERNPRSPASQGKTRLLQILISESAHLIWVLRCERIIHEDDHTKEEITARWLRKINERLTCDRITATKIVRNKTYTNLIKNTWRRTLQKSQDLPVNWINNREVLVGSGR